MPFLCYSSARLMLVLFLLTAISTVQAALYITKPRLHSKCFGGQSCTIEYLDDGESPLLSQISLCEIGLYTGNQKLVQQIIPKDVSDTLSFTFTPNPKAGPNSSNYYIAFTSVSLKSDNGTSYVGYSPFFSLEKMEGSFDSPLPAAISPIPLPSTSESATPTSTVTVGTPSRSMATARSTPPSSPSNSAFPTASTLFPSLLPSSSATPPDKANSASSRHDTNLLFLPALLLFALL